MRDITQPAPRITGLTIAHTRVPIIAPMMIATTFAVSFNGFATAYQPTADIRFKLTREDFVVATLFIWLNLRL